MRYRKKPVEVEAVRVQKPYARVKDFCPDALWVKEDSGRIAWVIVEALEGRMRADLGDWIISGVQGEFYPCKPEIFEATYEAVTDDA